MLKKSFQLLATAALVGSLVIPPGTVATAASSDGTIGKVCHQPGKTDWSIKKTYTSWSIRQHDRRENYSGSLRDLTFTSSAGATATASVSVNTEVTGKIKVSMFADFEAKVGTNVGFVGEQTRFASVTDHQRLASGDTYYYGRGARHVRALSPLRRCESFGPPDHVTHKWVRYSGRIDGYIERGDTVVGCKKHTDPGTLARAIKQRFC